MKGLYFERTGKIYILVFFKVKQPEMQNFVSS